MTTTPDAVEPSSFRDPGGFLFRNAAGTLLRQINQGYEAGYDRLMQSGLYQQLTERGWLIPHTQRPATDGWNSAAARVLQPREIPFISYPSEWCFSQLQDAAVLTLDIALEALRHGLILQDASAFNVQFEGARPVFIDTLSFAPYQAGRPWGAYSQFCRHFLAPLALIAKTDARLAQLLTGRVDGVDLGLATRLLPRRTLVSPRLLMHLHLNARFEQAFSSTRRRVEGKPPGKARHVSETGLTQILLSLRAAVAGLRWQPGKTTWSDYYDDNSYSQESFSRKQSVVHEMLSACQPRTVWDLGANTGVFSRLASQMGAYTCAFDIDPACVEGNYQACRAEGSANLLPLVLDLAAPTPAIGWALRERQSILQRGPCDAVLALALMHHLVIGNNVPLTALAEFLAELGGNLILEWVPKTDPQAQRLLRSRDDIFADYHREGFLAAFARWFQVTSAQELGSDGRTLYHFTRTPRTETH